MAAVVFVHGIAQEQSEAIPLEERWAMHLVGGVDRAGHHQLAERLWHRRHQPDGIACRMAFYGATFLAPGSQGATPAPLSAAEQGLAEQLARTWLEHARDRASHPAVRTEASRQLAAAHADPRRAQGTGRLAGGCIRRLAHIRWFAHLGYNAASIANRSLVQVTRYLTDPDIRRSTIDRVLALVDDDTRVIIAHSLGSIVAYEAAHQLPRPLPLLVTLGSPLGIRTIVYDRLTHHGFPPAVGHWVNIVDPDDFIAAHPDLSNLFGGDKPADAVFEGLLTVNNGAQPHNADFYLTKATVGGPVAAAFHGP